MDKLPLDFVVQETSAKKVGKSYKGHCPTHDDKNPSLSINEGRDGGVVINCFAGCESQKPFESLLSTYKLKNGQSGDVSSVKPSFKRASEYMYQDESGKTVSKVTRSKSKKFLQYHLFEDRWVSGGAKCKLQPYHFYKWKDSSRVFLVEGEKDVETMESYGFRATTTIGGSGGWRSEYGKYFKSKDVIVIPDNDKPGRSYAEKATNGILPFAKSVKRLDLPNLKEKGDVTDWFESIGSKDIFNQLITNNAYFIGKQVPLKLFRPPEQSKLYPLELLGNVLAPAIEQISYFTSSPVEICAQSFLAAASLAVQPHYDVVVDDKENPLSLNLFTISPSGGGKSSADKYALKEHKEHQKNLWAEYLKKFKENERKVCAYNEAKKKVLRDRKLKSPEQIDEALKSLGEAPVQVLAPHLILEDLTTEALMTQLDSGLPSLGIISDEGGQLLGGYSFNSDNAKKTAAGITKAWEGSDISIIRASGINLRLYGKRVCFHLMAQPKMASEFMQNEDFKDQGFINRMLIVWPENPIGKREFEQGSVADNPLIEPYYNRVKFLLNKAVRYSPKFENALEPKKIYLTKEAADFWRNYRQDIEYKLKEGEVYGEIQSFATRAAQNALRLAGLLAVFDGEEESVSLSYIQRGCGLATYYVDEYKRIFESSMLDSKLLNAQKVLDHIKEQKKYTTFHLAQIYQKGPSAIRNAESARGVLRVLEEHYHIKKIEGGGVFGGVRRTDSWEVIYED